MDFRVLGPLEVRAGGAALEVGPPQQGTVLAALTVDAGRLVPVQVLMDRVWGSRPPPHARRTLHTYLTRIRRLLERGCATDDHQVRLVRRTGGYVLDVDHDRVDLHRFRHLLDRARDPRCTDAQRVVLLHESLGLWRGDPLAGLPGEWAARKRENWRRQRLDAAVDWAKAHIRVGSPNVVVEPLTDLLGEHPLDEPVAAVLMRALFAAGRGADALNCYTAIRKRLAADLGVDAGAELQELHRAILRGCVEPAPAMPASPVPASPVPAPPASVPEPAAGVVPAQLPLEVSGFAGRTRELARLHALLPASRQAPGAVVIAVLSGSAGVGKSALAMHWAHRVAGNFPDGQLYVNLRGFHPTGTAMEPAEAVRRFLDAFEVPPQRIPASLDAQAGLYRSLLADRRVLVVLDNARDTEQIRPLLPGAPGCAVVVTSRSQLTGLVAGDGAHPITLDLLSTVEAHELLTRRVGPDRVAAEPDAVDQIIARSARLPLALSIVAARAATHPGFPLHTLADELRAAHGGLDAFAGGEASSDLRAVFSWSYRALGDGAAGLFRLLGLHPGPDLTAPATASLAGVPIRRVRPLLDELTRAHLITEHVPGRYTAHDLLRAYAAELAGTTGTDAWRHAATHRMLDHYLHTAYAADRRLDPHRDVVDLVAPQPGVTPEDLADHDSALAWLTTEHPVLLAAVAHAAGDGFDTHAWQLARTLTTFFDRQGHWHDQAAAHRTALRATQRLADRPGQAHTHRGLARAYTRLGRYDDANDHYRHALDLYGELGDHVSQAHTQINLGWVCERQGDYRGALGHGESALDLYRVAGYRSGQADALNTIGWCHALLGDHHEALARCQQALALHQEIGNRHSLAATWDSLGYVHQHLGNHREATSCYQHAIDLMRDLGDRYSEADALSHLGDAHQAAGDPGPARDAWRAALDVLEQLGHPDAARVRAKLDPAG
jgi:DNA-binding SARP family transcriptional activator/tetratricopeptide (TPR) repeat protein